MGAFHLLALEDNEEYQKVLRSMLSKYPGRSRLDVDIISGVTTFEALMASDDRIDIFITDIDLGEGNPSGIELVRRYFPAGSPTKVIYISGHVEFCTSVYQTEHTYFLWSGKEKLDFLLRILKRIVARIPLETCSPRWNACAPYCNRALCT